MLFDLFADVCSQDQGQVRIHDSSSRQVKVHGIDRSSKMADLAKFSSELHAYIYIKLNYKKQRLYNLILIYMYMYTSCICRHAYTVYIV